MRTVTLEESKAGTVVLTDDEASALQRAGRRLASDKGWWGEDNEFGQEPSQRTVIECSRVDGSEWRVRVRDAVGLVAVGDLQIEVRPKIPQSHLLHLFELAGAVPRLGEEQTLAARDRTLWELVATWFIGEAEKVLRRDLMRGYRYEAHHLKLVRGRLDPAGTGRAYYAGRLDYPCEFDEFTTDIPLNRVLLAAARVVGGSPLLDPQIRRRAFAVGARMDDVGELRPNDLRARIGRTTAHYTDALTLAHNVLSGHGRSIKAGDHMAWTFLLRTPEPVEAGVRRLLHDHLGHRWHIAKQGRRVTGSTMTFNPDLVFGHGLATGDVKYKLAGSEWRRSDLYQAIAFATIYETSNAVIVGFRNTSTTPLSDLDVGEMKVRHIDWVADPAMNPDRAASLLVQDVGMWLSGIDATSVASVG